MSIQAFASMILALSLLPSSAFAKLELADSGYDPITYQIGSEWGKFKITREKYQAESYAFKRAALATAKVGNGTGFYLGKFNGFHVVATNHHVCSIGAQCLSTNAVFPMLQKAYKLDYWMGTFADIDLTLMAITVPAADEALLAPIANNFAFSQDLLLGQKLLTIGFGAAGNPNGELMAGQDSDCIVLSRSGEYRNMTDPDDSSPTSDHVWSFASGCDISHGDSGSAVIDRQTGALLGLFWTGRIPKNAKVRSSAYIQSLKTQPNDDIWKELSYGVPAKKMADSIQKYANTTSWIPAEVKAALMKIIGR